MELSVLAASLTASSILIGAAGNKINFKGTEIKNSNIKASKIEEILNRTGTRLYNEDSRMIIRRKIDQAGLDIEPEYIIGLRLALPTVLLLISLPLMLLGIMDILWVMMLTLLAFMAPKMWLDTKAKKRKAEINKDILDFCISLSTILEAGADLLSAIVEVSNSLHGELAKEFLNAIDEMSVGKRRNDALYEMAVKNDVPDLIDLVRKIEQSERYGSPLADTVRNLTNQIIMRRKYEGVRKAGELTIKLLFPTVAFIFGPMLALMFYPIIVNMRGIF